MKKLNSTQIAELVAASNAEKREIPFANCNVDQDLDRDARHQIMRDLEDSDLINTALLDEIEDRILNDNPYYVIALVRKDRIAHYVAEGVEAWKAREIVDLEFATVSKSVAGFAGVDAKAEKAKAQQAIADRKKRFAEERVIEIAPKVYTDSQGDYYSQLSQTIKCTGKRRFAKPYAQFTAADEAKLARINTY